MKDRTRYKTKGQTNTNAPEFNVENPKGENLHMRISISHLQFIMHTAWDSNHIKDIGKCTHPRSADVIAANIRPHRVI